MATHAQKRAVAGYRQRLSERGLSRFEVLARPEDQPLIRSLAKKLSKNDAEATRLRKELSSDSTTSVSEKGGILAALLRAPRIDDDEMVLFEREWVDPRDVDL